MSAANKLVLYTARICPYAQRAAIALHEAGLSYESVEIDLLNKPEWYHKVNPDLKVPALEIQGKNIAESLVLVELINDLAPEKKLLPANPVQRAQVRFVIEFYSSKVTPLQYGYIRNFTEEGKQNFITGIATAYERLNELLLEQSPSGPYFLGDEYSIADIAIAPFAGRLEAFTKNYLKGHEWDIVKSSKRLSDFLKGIQERASYKETYCGDQDYVDVLVSRFGVPDPSKL
ncbi:thioredoxin-like protein [Syncephalastrum racemosum]|uniref:Thioredoxin-like protein n=1 Tax=Syncephalastrum racemosum TaxID=13706 RepID=A0A1X2HUX6_SYNRA|nr:thioredoxin-like protein [Syncephalastrum racemosum]